MFITLIPLGIKSKLHSYCLPNCIQMNLEPENYIGRYAPTPSGFLHKGHASTFAHVLKRAEQFGGSVLLRLEDLDQQRCKPLYEKCVLEDLRWLGLNWDGQWVKQSGRLDSYKRILNRLVELGYVYPSNVSRKQITQFSGLKFNRDGEPIFPNDLREELVNEVVGDAQYFQNWRFRVPDSMDIHFDDQRTGLKQFRTGVDLGDFLVWTKSGFPSYELAVVVDDLDMKITEVVRGEDLLTSTARQLLLYQVLDKKPPFFYHCPLVTDEKGIRLAKSYDSESIRSYRDRGYTAELFWKQLKV